MKPSQKCLWGLLLVIGLCTGLGLYASVTTAHDGDGSGELYIGNDPGKGPANPPPGSGGDPGGLEADPDTFSVDARTMPSIGDLVRFDPWVSQGILHRSVGWVLRLAIAKFIAAW